MKQTRRDPPKLDLVSRTCNPWNLGPGFNQEVQLLINLFLKDGNMKKNINLKKTC
jgi:hypothetical protein